MTWAWEQDVKPVGKFILVTLADHAGDDGVCWPSTARIEQRTGLAHSTVQDWLNKLEEGGWLVRRHQDRDGMKWVSKYVLLQTPAVVREPDNDVREADTPMSGSRTEGVREPDIEPSLNRQLEPSRPTSSRRQRRDALLATITPEETEAFETFWQMYGRVGPRLVAMECWLRRVRDGADPDAILDGLEAWCVYWRSPGAAKVKWPQGWLNERRWLDSPPPVSVAANVSTGQDAFVRMAQRRGA